MAKASDALTVNDRIHHEIYGLGTIAELNAARTTIEFDENGRRKFVTSMVKLERSTVAAPAPPPKKSRARKATPKAAPKTRSK